MKINTEEIRGTGESSRRKNSRKRTRKGRGKIALLLGCAALAGTMAAGGIYAYFTDGETVTNTFTVGRVSLDLEEPDWIPPENITPEQEIEKDPQIVNDGINDEFVFLEVAVPYWNVVTAEPDGSKNPAAELELFTYTVNTGWTEIGSGVKNTENQTVTHLYVYGTEAECTALAREETTHALFDSVRFINVVEGQGLEETTQHIILNAYGIQNSDINGGVTAPEEVWKVLSNQLPSTV